MKSGVQHFKACVCVVLLLLTDLIFSTTASAHDCDKFTDMELTPGRIKRYTITADVSESQESFYELSFNLDPNVALVEPPPNGGLQFKRGVFTVTGIAPGTTSVALNWSYAPNNAGGSCFFSIEVSDPDEERRSAAAHASATSHGDPINMWTGELYQDFPADIYIDSVIPLVFSRYYASGLIDDGQAVSTLGSNWLHAYEVSLVQTDDRIDIAFQRGLGLHFEKSGESWVLIDPLETPFQLIADDNDFVLMNPQDWMRWRFDESGRLTELSDRNDNMLTFGYDGLNLVSVSDAFGHALTLQYEFFQELISVSDGTRTINFEQQFSGNLRRVTDALGNVTQYAYDSSGRMLSETAPEGNTRYSQTYDTDGRVATQTDAAGHVFTLDYSGNTSTITDPLNNSRDIHHTSDGGMQSEADFGGQAASQSYDTVGRPVQFTNQGGGTSTTVYHAPSGRISSFTDAAGATTTYAWEAQVQDGHTFYNLASYTLDDGASYQFSYDERGNLLSLTNPLAETTTYTYNSRGQVTSQQMPLGETTTYTYYGDGMLASISVAGEQSATLLYDDLNRVTQVVDGDGNTRDFTYNYNNALLSQTNEHGETETLGYDGNGNLATLTDPLGNITTLTYDGNDRIASATDALGTTTYEYDERGRLTSVNQPTDEQAVMGWSDAGYPVSLTDGAGFTSTFAYDERGILSGITNPMGHTWNLQTDDMGSITAVTTPLGNLTNYTHDSTGQLTNITNPLGEQVNFEYSDVGELTAVRLPAGLEVSYVRDAEGSLSQITDPNGENWSRQHNTLGRIETATDPLDRTTTHTYDSRGRYDSVTFPSGRTLTLGYDGGDRVASRSYSDGLELAYTYDGASRLIEAEGVSLAYNSGGYISASNGQRMSYDGVGRLTSILYDTDKQVSYAYNECGLVELVTDWTGATTTISYNEATQLAAISRSNGTVSEYTYNEDGYLTGISHRLGEDVIASLTFTVNAVGDIVAAQRVLPASPPLASLRAGAFSYDAASQLTSATYDDDGRRTIDGEHRFTYDGANRVTNLQGSNGDISYGYDVFGNSISRTEGETTVEYLRNFAVGTGALTKIEDGTSRTFYVYLPNGHLLHSADDTGTSIRYYHFDESGSTLALTDADGALTDTYSMTPYGEALSHAGQSANPFTYHGAYGVLSEGDDLYRMGPRIYDAKSAAFLTRDPLQVPQPRTINPYVFAHNNPIRFMDPWGTSPTQSEPAADLFTPDNPGFLSGSFFAGVDKALDMKRMDQIDQAIKHADQFPTRNPFPVIADAVKTEKLMSGLDKFGNVVGFGIDAFQEGAQARKEGKGWGQTIVRGGVGGGTGLALGAANPVVALVDGLTGENFSHSIKQVYRVPEALLGDNRARRAYTNAARSGDYSWVVQVTNHAGEMYADKGVLETLGGITAQGFDDTILSIGYSWLGGPVTYTPTKRHQERMRKRREAQMKTLEERNSRRKPAGGSNKS